MAVTFPIFEDGLYEDCTCEYGVEVIDAAERDVRCNVCGFRFTVQDDAEWAAIVSQQEGQ